jgi:hypothetical protein
MSCTGTTRVAGLIVTAVPVFSLLSASALARAHHRGHHAHHRRRGLIQWSW